MTLKILVERLTELAKKPVSMEDALAVALGISGFTSKGQLDAYKEAVKLARKKKTND